MSFRQLPAFFFSVLMLLVSFTNTVQAEPGLPDGLEIDIDGNAYAVAMQPDGRILLGGNFTSINGVTRNCLARLNPDGGLDLTFSPSSASTVYAIAVLADGDILVAGKNYYLRRLNANGTNDTGFSSPTFTHSGSPYTNGAPDVSSFFGLTAQPDGKLMVAGDFKSVNSTARHLLARLNSDGSNDTTFFAPFNSTSGSYSPAYNVMSVARQGDGKYVVGGLWGVARNLCRLDSSGVPDDTFHQVVLNGTRSNVVVLEDGRILNSHPSGQIIRHLANGVRDPAYNVSLSGTDGVAMQGITPLTSGGVLTYGQFNTIGGMPRNGLAHVGPEGAVEPFNANQDADATVQGLAVQRDGRVLLSRSFSTTTTPARSRFIRIQGDVAADQLVVVDSIHVQWLRSGAGPEVSDPVFEASTNGGASWSLLGSPARISGGWEMTSLSLPASGEVRARGRTISGANNGSSGLIQTMTAFGSATPAVTFEEPAGTGLTNGATLAFADTLQSLNSVTKTVTVRNPGTATLNLDSFDLSGAGMGEFVLDLSGTTLQLSAGQQTSFKVTFKPRSAGTFAAVLTLAHNADGGPFVLNLTGKGILSSDATLSFLWPSVGSLSPFFSAANTSYNVFSAYGVTSASLWPTPTHLRAVVTVNGAALLPNGSSAPFDLPVGSTPVTVLVTAEDGVTTKTITVNFVRRAPVAGDPDLTYDPMVGAYPGQIDGAALDAEGRLVIGGAFETVGETDVMRLARLKIEGTLDPDFQASATDAVESVGIDERDGILIGGAFSFANSVARPRLARLEKNGALDLSLNPAALTGTVYGLEQLSEGRIALKGNFALGSPAVRADFAVLSADGSVHPDFNIAGLNFNSSSTMPVLFSDQQLFLVQNDLWQLIGRDGTDDPSFLPVVTGYTTCTAVEPSGTILVAGSLRRPGGSNFRTDIVRISPTGEMDATFTPPFTGGTINAMAVQADGKILAAGTFTATGLSGTRYLIRLNADGTRDTSFTSFTTAFGSTVDGIMIQKDGQVLIQGTFNSVNGAERRGLARLQNQTTATESLSVTDSNSAQWLLGGTGPSADRVNFESSTDGGVTWAMSGAGTRMAGGWKGENLDLPASGLLRARGTVASGKFGRSFSVVQGASVPFTFPVQQVVVEQPSGTPAANGGSRDFGNAGAGGVAKMDFLLGNAGGINLNGVALSITGPDAALFRIVAPPPARVTPGGTAAFTVEFSPVSVGAKSATLHIVSNDPAAPEFTIALSGTGVRTVAPIVSTLPATDLKVESATLNASVNARGSAREVTFEYGLTKAYGESAPAAPFTVSGRQFTKVSAQLTGLQPHTTYHYRARARGPMGESVGSGMTFTTDNRPPVLEPDAAVLLPGATVTVHVLANDVHGDPDGDVLSLASVQKLLPANAGKVVKSGNQVVFTAGARFAGATCTYTARDGFGGSATGTITFGLGTCEPETLPLLPPGENTATLHVAANGYWSAAESVPWITLQPAGLVGESTGIDHLYGNNDILVTLRANPGKAERKAALLVGGKQVLVRQAGVVKPTVVDSGDFQTYVGGQFGISFEAAFDPAGYASPVTWRAANLPPGLRAEGDYFLGHPTKAGTYEVTITASNAAGTSAPMKMNIIVDPIDVRRVGTFHGYVEGEPVINGNRGSRLEMTTTATGAVTGKVITGTTSRSFVGTQANGTVQATIKNGAAVQTLSGYLSPKEGVLLGGMVSDEMGNVAVAHAWRNTWTAANKASAYKGRYTFGLEQPVAGAALPEGYGHGAFTVNEANGALTVSGRLPDGSTLSSRTFVGPDGQVLIYQALAGQKDSLCGELTITRGAEPADNTLAGSPLWFHAPLPAATAGGLYRDGFGPAALTAFGSVYQAPAKGAVLMDLPSISPNARLTFSHGGLEEEENVFVQDFKLSSPGASSLTNQVAFNGVINSLRLPVLNAGTGAFNGSFVLPAVPGTALRRQAAFQGQMVKRDGLLRGYGYFLLPAPAPTAAAQAAAARRSGRVVLSPTPP